MADFLAPRMTRFQPSASTAAAARARGLKAAGRDIIDLSLGEPDFATPENVKAAARRALEEDQTHYTNVAGTPALIEAIREKFQRENGLAYGADEIIASTGGKQVMFNAFLATVREGDEIIVPVPYWISYPNQALVADGRPVFVPCPEASGFKLQARDLDAAIGEKTRWVVVNSPANPSGAVYSGDELAALAAVLKRHPEVLVMADEIYEHLIYGGAEHHSLVRLEPALRDRTLVVNGVSKAYAMTGWRLGYGAGPAWLIRAMVKLQSQATSCPSSISQAAAVEALSGPQAVLAERRAIMEQRRDAIFEALAQIDGITAHRPEGALYLFCNCQGLVGRRRPDGGVIGDDGDVVAYLLEAAGVAVVPGGAYGLPGYFRLSFATRTEALLEGGRRIRQAVAALT
jgi:aspartate aminotransferase